MGRLGKHNANKHEAVVGGQRCKFDSMAEHRYAEWLERERKAGRIKGWAHHVSRVPLRSFTGSVVATMRPDFTVAPLRGVAELHEVKGLATALWRRDRRHLEADQGYTYVVIDAGRGVCATGKGEPALFDERPKRKRRKK